MASLFCRFLPLFVYHLFFAVSRINQHYINYCFPNRAWKTTGVITKASFLLLFQCILWVMDYENLQNVWDKLKFSCEMGHYGKSSISAFQEFFASIEKKSFWEEYWELGYNSMNFWDFPDISKLPKILRLKSFGNSLSNSYLPCLILIITLYVTCGESKICQTSKILQILWP